MFLTEPKEAICTQDDYSPCAFPYKIGNKTYNGCLRRPGEEEEGPQCPDRTDLDGTNATWWRKCGSGCPEGGKQNECYCFFHYEIFSSICYNILQFQNVLVMTRQTVGPHHLAYFLLCMKDSITQGA